MIQKLFGISCFFSMMFLTNLHCQSLYLKVVGENENETKIIDSLNYKKKFQDFLSLNEEILNLKKRIENIGYIESKSIGLKKENDSTFLGKFLLKSRYKSIHINYSGIIDKKDINFVSTKITDTYSRCPPRRRA